MKLRGVGVSTMMYGFGYGFSRPDFASAEVEIASDGTVTLWSGASELGQGIRTALCQIAAQELGVATKRPELSPRIPPAPRIGPCLGQPVGVYPRTGCYRCLP